MIAQITNYCQEYGVPIGEKYPYLLYMKNTDFEFVFCIVHKFVIYRLPLIPNRYNFQEPVDSMSC